VVATRAGGIPLQMRPDVDGKLVEAGDQEAIADAIYELFTKYQKGSIAAVNDDRLAIEKPRGGRWKDDDGLKLPSEEFLTMGNSVSIVENERKGRDSDIDGFPPN
jgi:hypothetical protein